MKLYLLPEDDDKAKAVNAETLQKAEAIKNQRVQEILSGKLETVKASLEHPASTTTSSKKNARLSKKKKVGSDKTGKSVKGKESEVNEVVGAVGVCRGTLLGGTRTEIHDRKGWVSSRERPHGRDETGSCR